VPNRQPQYAATTFTGSLVFRPRVRTRYQSRFRCSKPTRTKIHVEHDVQVRFQGTATFNVVPSTSTLLSSSHNPSVVGQSVTYTATVVSGDGSGNHHNSNSPTGTVTFKDGSITIAPTCQSLGTRRIVHSNLHTPDLPRDRNTSDHSSLHELRRELRESTSSVLNQLVHRLENRPSILTSWPNPSVVGFPVSLTASVFGTPSVPSGQQRLEPSVLSRYTDHVTLLIGTETLTANGKRR